MLKQRIVLVLVDCVMPGSMPDPVGKNMNGMFHVEQSDFIQPLRGDWIARLEEVVQLHQKNANVELEFLAFGLGAVLLAAWCELSPNSRAKSIVGAKLVRPTSPLHLHSWRKHATLHFPFPVVFCDA